jgi:hypothetical protein
MREERETSMMCFAFSLISLSHLERERERGLLSPRLVLPSVHLLILE